jgi:hypothetical protein
MGGFLFSSLSFRDGRSWTEKVEKPAEALGSGWAGPKTRRFFFFFA